MSTKHVTAYYLDARDGRPASEAPLRHGPVKPSDNLEIDAVDRRQRPALIIGRIPSDETLAAGMTLISEQEHADLLADHQAWRDSLAAQELSRLRLAKHEEINAGYQAEMEIITDDYPPAEIETWGKQDREAREWRGNGNAPTPFLDAYVAARGKSKQEVVDHITAKAEQWALASGTATGKRQALEDAIEAAFAAEDRDALEAVQW
jgi:hypothetical protein